MHFLSGIIGVMFLIVSSLLWQNPWLASVYLVCTLLAFGVIRPVKVPWVLYISAIVAAVCAMFFFFVFFALVDFIFNSFNWVESWSEHRVLNSFELGIFVSAFAMTFIVCEFCCWLKDRQKLVNLKIPLQKSGENHQTVAVSRIQ